METVQDRIFIRSLKLPHGGGFNSSHSISSWTCEQIAIFVLINDRLHCSPLPRKQKYGFGRRPTTVIIIKLQTRSENKSFLLDSFIGMLINLYYALAYFVSRAGHLATWSDLCSTDCKNLILCFCFCLFRLKLDGSFRSPASHRPHKIRFF